VEDCSLHYCSSFTGSSVSFIGRKLESCRHRRRWRRWGVCRRTWSTAAAGSDAVWRGPLPSDPPCSASTARTVSRPPGSRCRRHDDRPRRRTDAVQDTAAPAAAPLCTWSASYKTTSLLRADMRTYIYMYMSLIEHRWLNCPKVAASLQFYRTTVGFNVTPNC